MNPAAAVWYIVGLLAALLLIARLAKPIGMALRVVGNSIVGAIALGGLNLIGSYWGLHIGVNPVTALIMGMLGLPGLLGLGAIAWILR